MAAARERGTRIVSGRAGLALRSGTASVRIVGPLHATRASSPNDAALVVLARQGACSFLLPADAESQVLLGDDLGPAGVLEVSHHGSGDPFLARLLARVRPRLAVISVGAHNTLRPSVARRRSLPLRRAGVPVRRTDREGDIALGCRPPRMTRVRSRAMSAAPLDPIYLIGGTDRPKVELAIRRLRARVRGEDGSIEEFTARRQDDDGEGMSGEEAAGACNALGLFGGTRLIVVRGAEVWGDDKKAVADVDALAAYLPAPAPDAVLALLTTGEVPAGRLRTLVEEAGSVLAYDLPGKRGSARVAAQAGRARRSRPRRERAHAPAGAGRRRHAGARERGREARPLVARRDDHRRARRRAVRADRRHAALGSDRCARRPAPGRRAARARAPARRARRRRAALGAVDRAPPAPARRRAARRRAGRRAQGHRARARAAQRVRRPQALAPVGALDAASNSPRRSCASRSVERETRGEGVLRDRFALERALTEAVGPGR